MITISNQGGGCLGKGQAVALAAVENRLGKPLCSVVGLVGGTSVGSIITGAIALGVPMARVNQFFDDDAPLIFHGGAIALMRIWHSAKYDPEPLEHALQEMVGDATLADCKTRFVATAVDMNSGRNVYFQSYGVSSQDDTEIIIGPDSGVRIWEVMRSSSAAQTYFPGYRLSLNIPNIGPLDLCLWDGGSTGCNAPDMLVYTEAQAFAPENEIKMLSLGAGRMKWKFLGMDLVNPPIKDALAATLEIVYACGETNEVWQARTFLRDRHLRLNADLGLGFAIDDSTPATFATMTEAWQEELAKYLPRLGTLFSMVDF